MRHLLASLFILALTVIPARAAEPADSIALVVEDQINAFQRSDLPSAFAHASPAIQGIFGSPERFGTMVEGGYPMIWRPARWEMMSLATKGDTLIQTVMFEAQDGMFFEADYEMIQIDDVWRINGVSLRKLPGVGS